MQQGPQQMMLKLSAGVAVGLLIMSGACETTRGGTAGAGGAAGTGGGMGGGGGIGGGGASGAGGSAAVFYCPYNDLGAPCGAALCGNGMRDSCHLTSPDTFPTEECDGTDLGSSTCESFGFASGTLACNASCSLDDSGCDECVASAPNVARCGRAPVAVRTPRLLAIAATDAEVALAWYGLDGNGVNPALRFARLAPTLDLIGETKLDDGCSTSGIALAPATSGWILAADLEFPGTRVFQARAIDSSGQEAARTTVEELVVTGDQYVAEASPLLASRPGGGPLMVWQIIDSLGAVRIHAAVISDDGKSASSPIEIPTVATRGPGSVGAAFAGDAFYVTFSQGDDLVLARIPPDGASVSLIPVLPGESGSMPTLVSGSDDLRLVYAEYGNPAGSKARWRRINEQGVAIASAEMVGQCGDQVHGRGCRSVALGDDAFHDREERPRGLFDLHRRRHWNRARGAGWPGNDARHQHRARATVHFV